jgi:hypothetical protein
MTHTSNTPGADPRDEFTPQQLEQYATAQLDEHSELARRMDQDLLNNPNGQVSRFLKEIAEQARTAFDVNWGALLKHTTDDEHEGR